MGFWRQILSAHAEFFHNLEQIEFEVGALGGTPSQSWEEVGSADLGDMQRGCGYPAYFCGPRGTCGWRKGLVSASF